MSAFVPSKVCHLKVDSRESSRNLMVLGFNDTSTLVGHFVPSPREREKRDRRDIKERDGEKGK